MTHANAIHHNAATAVSEEVREARTAQIAPAHAMPTARRRGGSLTTRRGRNEASGPAQRQPESEQMPLALGLGKVLILRARMEDQVIGEELDVAGLELHVQIELRPARDLLVEIEERLL